MSASFVYDGLGRREAKTVNGNLTEFLYDGRNPVQETSGATILANILPGLRIDEFLTRTDVAAGVTSTFLTDALGSPVAVTDNAGAVQTEYTYEPFGKTTFSGASNSSSYQYTGRENDGTGLYYYRARYYHPGLQRFIREDPIEFLGGDANLYSYVSSRPLSHTDPLGLVWWLEAAKEVFAHVFAESIIHTFDEIRDYVNRPVEDPVRDSVNQLTDDDNGDGVPNYRDPTHPLCQQLGNCPPPPSPPPCQEMGTCPPPPPPCRGRKC